MAGDHGGESGCRHVAARQRLHARLAQQSEARPAHGGRDRRAPSRARRRDRGDVVGAAEDRARNHGVDGPSARHV